MSFVNTIRTKKLVSSSLILFTLSIGILIGPLINTGVKAAKDTPAPRATPLVIPNPAQLSTAFSQLGNQLEPSVVNISTTCQPKQTSAQAARRGNSRRRAVPAPDADDGDGDDSM